MILWWTVSCNVAIPSREDGYWLPSVVEERPRQLRKWSIFYGTVSMTDDVLQEQDAKAAWQIKLQLALVDDRRDLWQGSWWLCRRSDANQDGCQGWNKRPALLALPLHPLSAALSTGHLRRIASHLRLR